MCPAAKRLLLTIPFLGACGASPGVLSDAERSAVAGEVSFALSQLTEAMNARDAEAVLSFYDESPDFRYLGCTDFIVGGETFRRLVQPFYSSGQGAPFEQDIVSVHVVSATAALVSQRGSSSDAGALFWTQLLVKKDASWVITYEHESWPGCDEPSEPHPYTQAGDSAALKPGGTGR